MKGHEEPVEKPKVEARQADTQSGTKRVLYVSTALGIIVLLIALWWISSG